MRSLLRKSMLTAGALALVGGVAARADAQESLLRVKVPFQFVVHGKTLPAGEYLIERLDLSPNVLLIEGTKDVKEAAMVSTMTAAGHDPKGDTPVVTFTHHENEYQLQSVWESEGDGQTVISNSNRHASLKADATESHAETIALNAEAIHRANNH